MFEFAHVEAPKIIRSQSYRHHQGQPRQSFFGRPLWQAKLYRNASDVRYRYDLISHPYRHLISQITFLRIYRFL